MKTVDQLTSHELEIELLKRAIVRGDALLELLAVQAEALLRKQRGRVRELAVQETLLKQTDH